jgi:hypothetical protein
MTHLQNIFHILKYGITHINSPNRNPNYIPIGDGSLITSRNAFILPNGRSLGEYIPFYFGPRMPMLYVIQNGFNGVQVRKPAEIVYCVLSVGSIEKTNPDYIFSDGHAIDGLTSFYYPTDNDNFENIIDLAAIKSKYCRNDNDLDLKRRKEAEFLILGDIPAESIIGFAVYNKEAEQQIMGMPHFEGKKLIVKPDYYF